MSKTVTKEKLQELPARGLSELKETYFGGIRKVLFWSGVDAYVKVEDNKGRDFVVPIPQPGYEDKGPLWHFDHAMLFGPETIGRSAVYAVTES